MNRWNDLRKLKLSLGHGRDSFPMKHGSFQYNEELDFRKETLLSVIAEDDTRLLLCVRDKHGETLGRLQAKKEGALIRLHLSLSDPGINRFWYTFPMEENEHFYGGGETFSTFDLRGELLRIWVAEHQNGEKIAKKLTRMADPDFSSKAAEPLEKYESYYAQPTIVSSRKYFIHAETTAYSSFDFRGADQFTVELRQNGDLFIGNAASFPALSGLLGSLLGRQRRLPEWIYDGITLGIQRGTRSVDEKLERAAEYGVKVNGVWCQDWCGCRRTGFGYQVMWNWEADEELYPRLKEKIREWKAKGVHFLGYINPFLAQEKDLYAYASARGYCVKDMSGKDYLAAITTFSAALIDFTNPEAYEWYKSIIRKNMIDIGMSGWMADFGEYLPADCVLYSGEDPKLLHNQWPEIWAGLNREAIREAGKEDEIFFFTRAGYTGSISRSMMMWNGDQHVDWSVDDGIASVIPATLSLAMSGFCITHSDVGGYTTAQGMTRSRELLMRWEELNAFSPYMRSHEGNRPFDNVQFDGDGELLAHLAGMVNIHTQLKPYLKECVLQAECEGLPVMRPLFYHYDEPEAYTESYEYLLGRDLLIAPVLTEGAVVRECYLPRDTWIYLPKGKICDGGRITVPAKPGYPPVFLRAASPWREQLIQLWNRRESL